MAMRLLGFLSTLLTCLSFTTALTRPLHAEFIVTPNALATTYRFNQFSNGFQFASGSIEIAPTGSPSVSWSSTTPSAGVGVYSSGEVANAMIGSPSYYGLGSNGNWGSSWESSRGGFVGLNSNSNSMTFTFNDFTVGEVGGLVNYSPEWGPFTLEALSASGASLEVVEVNSRGAITTSGQTNHGAFRGIARSQNDIASLRISGAYGVLDDLSFYTPVGIGPPPTVPEPSSIALLTIGSVSLAINAVRRRFKRKSRSPVSIV